MSSNSKVSVPPQYTTCLACGSVGAASTGAVSAIVMVGCGRLYQGRWITGRQDL